MKSLIIIFMLVLLLGSIGCKQDSIDTFTDLSTIDKIMMWDEAGNLTTIKMDRITGDVMSSDSQADLRTDPTYPDGYVFRGTVKKIEHWPNGNRTITCINSEDVCYTVGKGPGPCETCNL